MTMTLKEFLESIILENLHPELHAIAVQKTTRYGTSKQTLLAKKIKELSERGESTGLEGNMPKGSSRAYLPIKEHHEINLDGHTAKIKTGMKVAIRAALDKHHKAAEHDNMSLGQLQNKAEGGDYLINSHYRIATKDEKGHFRTNTDSGIFPPQIDHDHDGHEWTHVGHADKLTEKSFKELTKTTSHPEGIHFSKFNNVLKRAWDRDHGKYWKGPDQHENNLDHVETHPLVQKFLNHQRDFNSPPHDYTNIGNMGIWKHPVTGEDHIVARDHGYSHEVMGAYKKAREKERDNFLSKARRS